MSNDSNDADKNSSGAEVEALRAAAETADGHAWVFIAATDRWGERLSRFRVVKETDKTITIDRNTQERITGGGLYKQTYRKGDPSTLITTSGAEAAKFLIEHADKRTAVLRSQIQQIESNTGQLRKLLKTHRSSK